MSVRITDWLSTLGLEKYSGAFEAQDIDFRSLPHLTESDLRELGVSLGHRRVILAAAAKLAPDQLTSPGLAPPSDGATVSQERPANSAERRLVSVLFCDMVDSTELTRQLDPEDMRDVLRDYQDRIAGAIARYGGHLAQYLGDGVMAFFGWPTAYEDQAERAVRAGLEALTAIRALETGTGRPPRIRVAIATGPVVVGDLSSAGRQEGAIAGETPNLAARLQQCAEPDQLVVSEATLNLIGEAFRVHDGGHHRLKGFAEGARIFRIEGLRDVETRFEATRGQNLSRFVGRTHELINALEKWDLACVSEGQVLLIAGEAGIGKSRLVRAIADKLTDTPHRRWQLQCSPYHMSSALYPVVHSLSRHLGLGPEVPGESQLEKIEKLVREANGDPTAGVPLFAELLSVDTAGRYEKPRLTPQELKALTLGSLVDRCLAFARDAPLLLVVEDAHWIDPTTRELVEQTIARIANARVLMLITHRPEWRTEWTSIYPQASTISLGRLPRPHAAELVKDLVGASAEEELISEITMRTDGIPMFVEEVARSLLEAEKDNNLSFQVPATLQGALMARLDGLPQLAREVVQAASIMGREFDPEVIANVCRLPPLEMAIAVEELTRARLITRSGLAPGKLYFRHALIQDVAYQSLLRSKRRTLHRAVAAELARAHPDVAETQPELLARHLTDSGDFAPALCHWRNAGQRALARYANDEAASHFERALEVARELPIIEDRGREVLACELDLGRAQRSASQLAASMASFQRASDLARARNNTSAFLTAALGFDNSEFNSSDPSFTSVALLSEGLGRLAADQDSHDHCQLLSRLARAHLMSGRLEHAEIFTRRAEVMARSLHDDYTLAEVLILGFLAPKPGFEPAQLPLIEAQLAELSNLAVRRTDDDLIGRVKSLSFYQWTELGQRARMDEILEQHSLWADERQYVLIQWIVCHARALIAILEGRFAQAEAHAEQGLDMGRRSHGDQAEGVYGMQMFTIRREQGRLAEIAPIIKQLIDDNPTEPFWRPGFALVASELGFDAAAARTLAEVAEGGFAFPRDAKRSTTLSYLAEICSVLRDKPRAEMLYAILKPYQHMTITAGVASVCYGAAGRFLGQLADVLDAWDDAEQHFESALELDRAMQAAPWLAHTQHQFARMLRRRGRAHDIQRADRLVGEAWASAESLGMVSLIDKLRRLRH